MERFREVAPRDQVRQPLQKFAHVNGSAVKIEQPLGENGDRDHAADQDRPHEQTALLDVIDHAGLFL